jgi:hypothetical protein
MSDLNEIYRIQNACQDWYCLQKDRKHCKLQVSVKGCRQVACINNHQANSCVVDEAKGEHAEVPAEFIIVVVVELQLINWKRLTNDS